MDVRAVSTQSKSEVNFTSLLLCVYIVYSPLSALITNLAMSVLSTVMSLKYSLPLPNTLPHMIATCYDVIIGKRGIYTERDLLL